MPILDILSKKEIKPILHALQEQFGFSGSLDYVFLMNKQHKVYIVNKEVFDLGLDGLRVDKLGMYFGESQQDGFRLSPEGSQLIAPLATKGILELSEEETKAWLEGNLIERKIPLQGYILLRDARTKDILGCGKSTKKGILNFYPKTRRISL